MKNQVTSIEQSRRLIELGVPAEKAGMCWVRDPNEGDYNLCVHDEYCYEVAAIEPRPAFTVADLLGILPNCISNDDGITTNHYYLTLSRGELNWEAFYEDVIGVDELIRAGEIGGIITTLICLIEWLVSNGYKLEV